MKIQIERQVVVTEEMEVEFPVYLCYEGDADTWQRYTTIKKLLASGHYVKVSVEQSWSSTRPTFSISQGTYMPSEFGRIVGPYIPPNPLSDCRMASPSEFAELLKEVQDLVNEVVLL